jgi:AraC-like DNA-binding protein
MGAYFERRIYHDGFPLTTDYLNNLDFHAHWHNEVECILVVSGSLFVGAKGAERELRAGDLALMASGDIHYFCARGRESRILTAVFRPELVDCPEGWPASGCLATNFILKEERPELAQRAAALMEGVHEEKQRKAPAWEGMVRAKLLELCAGFERECLRGDRRERPAEEEPQGQMRKILEYIETGASFPITLADIARVTGLSPSYVSRLFAKTVGTSLPAYLNSIRVKKAQRLLMETDEQISTVAARCGFESLRTFNRAFLAVSGETPNAWRKNPRTGATELAHA